jgi:uncharacterized phage protein (TIGR01671 family)
MRKIKFRAWDKENKEMFNTGTGFNDVPEEIKIESVKRKIKISSVKFILMQYTGLKDKNEKEIYEGDVVKDVGIIGEIIYVECSFRINPEGNKKIEFTESLLNYDNLEVIGNIHENPELLTNK